MDSPERPSVMLHSSISFFYYKKITNNEIFRITEKWESNYYLFIPKLLCIQEKVYLHIL